MNFLMSDKVIKFMVGDRILKHRILLDTKTLIIVLIIVFVGYGLYFIFRKKNEYPNN